MKYIAKPVYQNFWILEDDLGSRVGTLSSTGNSVVASIRGDDSSYHSSKFESMAQAVDFLNIYFHTAEPSVPDSEKEETYEVEGYPALCKPFKPTIDVKNKLPIFVKNERSSSFHAAGYYIIQFDAGWVPSFCPKTVTLLGAKSYAGPFKTKFEMQERLRLAK